MDWPGYTCPVIGRILCIVLYEGDRWEVGTYVSKSLYIRTIQCSDVNTCRQGPAIHSGEMSSWKGPSTTVKSVGMVTTKAVWDCRCPQS